MIAQPWKFETTVTGIQVSLDGIEAHLLNSHGKPTMSNEDVKVCLIHVMCALEDIKKAMESLAKEPDTPEKKSFIQKLFKK